MSNSFDNSYPAFPVIAFLSILLVLIPLPWHLQAQNSGTCLFMIWTAVACLNQFINSIIWHGNAIDWAPIWCDISTRITVGVAVALPASSLCINRRLYKIATCQIVNITPAHKRRAVLVDLAIGLGIPALQMVLQFIVQGHRYDIWEDIGCFPTTVNTPPAYPLSFVWPNAISLVSATYCILTLKAFMMRRAQFSQFLSSSSSFSVNQYFRLMALATCEIIFTIPISTYGLYLNITSQPIYPWKSWSDIHFDWYIIGSFPAILWRNNTAVVSSFELNRWSIILCALVFFGFFGFAEEARKHYQLAFKAITRRFKALHPPSPKSKLQVMVVQDQKSDGLELPSFVQQTSSPVTKKSDRFNSMASVESLDSRLSSDFGKTVYSPTSTDTKLTLFSFSRTTDSSNRHSRSTI